MLEGCSRQYVNHSGLGDVRLGLCIHDVTALLSKGGFVQQVVKVVPFPGLSNLNISEQLGIIQITGEYEAKNESNGIKQPQMILNALEDLPVVFHHMGANTSFDKIHNLLEHAEMSGNALTFRRIAPHFSAVDFGPKEEDDAWQEFMKSVQVQTGHRMWDDGCLNLRSACCMCCNTTRTAQWE